MTPKRNLLIAFMFFIALQLFAATPIEGLLERIDNDTVDMKVQLFVKYLRTDPNQFGLLYDKIVDNFLNGNFHVLSSEDYRI